MRPIAIDGGEAKKSLCLSMGAEAFVDFKETTDVVAEVIKIADGIGAHGVLVTAYQAYKGKSISALQECVQSANKPAHSRLHEVRWQQNRRKDHVHCPASLWRGPTR